MDDEFLKAKARETAEALVAVYGHDRELLVRAIERLTLAGLRCGVEAYLRGLE
jgi:hypothetical protein